MFSRLTQSSRRNEYQTGAPVGQQGPWVELNQSLFSRGIVRVAVVPVGDFPHDRLQQWVSTFNAYNHVKLQDLHSFYRDEGLSPFKMVPWRTGSMHFHFEVVKDIGAQQSSKLAEMDRHLAFLAVIAVCNCDQAADATEAYAAYQSSVMRVLSTYNVTMPTCRLLGFGSDAVVSRWRQTTAEQPDMEGVVVLTRSELEGSAMLTFFMLDFAGCMHMNLAKMALHLQPQEMPLDTAVDAMFGPGVGRDKLQDTKRRMARWAKRIGDLCLLAGSPLDAKQHFESAISTGRPLGELVLTGAALESLAAVVLLDAASADAAVTVMLDRYDKRSKPAGRSDDDSMSAQLSTESRSDSVGPPSISRPASPSSPMSLLRLLDHQTDAPWSEASEAERARMLAISRLMSLGCVSTPAICDKLREQGVVAAVQGRMDEALAAYRESNAWPCVLMLKLKAARFKSGITSRAWRSAVMAVLMSIVQEAPSLPSLHDQLLVQLDVANICKVIGAHRKRLFLLSEASRILGGRYTLNDDALVQQICDGLRVPTGDGAMPPPVSSRREDRRASQEGGERAEAWTISISPRLRNAHMDVLKSMTSCAHNSKAWLYAWSAGSKLLHDYALMLRKEHQIDILHLLEGALQEMVRERKGDSDTVISLPDGPPPMIKCAAVRPLPLELRPVVLPRTSRHKAAQQESELFKYKADNSKPRPALEASAAKSKEGVIWVEDESGVVDVYVLNPFLTAMPRQSDKYLVLSLATHLVPVSVSGCATASPRTSGTVIGAHGAAALAQQRGAARSFQVQVPASLNLKHREVSDFASKGRTSLRVRPQHAGKLVLQGVNITWLQGRWLQPWCEWLPGERARAQALEVYSCPRHRQEQAMAHTMQRRGIATREESRPAPTFTIPVAPAQPLLQLTVKLPVTAISAAEEVDAAALVSPTKQSSMHVSAALPAKSRAGSGEVTMPEVFELTLVEGECATVMLVLENVGRYAVDRIMLDVHSKHNLAAQHCQSAHPLVRFSGVYAHARTQSIRMPLASKHAANAQATTQIPLWITAGTRAHASSAGAADAPASPVSITISYWSEKCQPAKGLVSGLEAPAEQALGRQICKTLYVRVLPHLRVALVRAHLPALAPPEPSHGSGDIEAEGSVSAGGKVDLELTISHHRSCTPVEVCVCLRSELAELIDSSTSGPHVTLSKSVRSFARNKACFKLDASTPTAALRLPVKIFPAVKQFSSQPKPGSQSRGCTMQPLEDQLQVSAIHFAGLVAVLWRADVPNAHAADFVSPHSSATVNVLDPLSPTRSSVSGCVWGSLCLSKHTFLDREALVRSELRRMMDAAVTSHVTWEVQGTLSERNGDAAAPTPLAHPASVKLLQPLCLHARLLCATHERVHATVRWRFSSAAETLHLDRTDRYQSLRASVPVPQGNATALFATPPSQGLNLRKPRPRTRFGGSTIPAAPNVQDTDSSASDAFIAAGTSAATVRVGQQHPKLLELRGMFIRTGVFEVCCEILELTDPDTNEKLPVEDYVLCHPAIIRVSSSAAQ